MAAYYDKGELVRCSCSFINRATSAAVDPASVVCKYTKPGQATTTLTYGTDNALVKDATGLYHVDLNANVSGVWTYRWESTGANQGAIEGSFEVRGSAF